MVSLKRWQYAQEYEKGFWKRTAEKIVSGTTSQLTWYEWKADEMEKRLKGYLNEDQKQTARVLEVGSGPIGIVSFLKWGERYTIDSLEDFYRSNTALSHHRDPAVCYGRGTGEQLPFENDYFSLVVLDNVLDHVHNAGSILNEIHRVISKGGLLYLAVNLHTNWGAFLHSVISKLMIDKGHPYTFNLRNIRRFLKQHQFVVLSETINDYCEAREKDKKSALLKAKIKGNTGLSEFIYYVVCSKERG